MHPANDRWSYDVTSFLIGWVHTQNDPWGYAISIVWTPFWNLHKNGYCVSKFVMIDHAS